MSKLIADVILEIKQQLLEGDSTAIEGLLEKSPEIQLIAFLPEEKWKEHGDKELIDQEMHYMASHGSKCPKCKSDDITAGSHEADGDYITQSVDCNDCEHTWNDNFQLTGIFYKD